MFIPVYGCALALEPQRWSALLVAARSFTPLASRVMKATLRSAGFDLPGVSTAALVASLPRPYDLIMRWTAYLELQEVLDLDWLALEIYRDNDDGTISLPLRTGWSRPHATCDLVVSLDLFLTTRAYNIFERMTLRGYKVDPLGFDREFLFADRDTLRRIDAHKFLGEIAIAISTAFVAVENVDP